MTAAPKYTAGPLLLSLSRTASGNKTVHVYITDKTGRKVGVCWGKEEEKEANACLWSMAPDMIEVIEQMVADWERGVVATATIEKAVSISKQARGEEIIK